MGFAPGPGQGGTSSIAGSTDVSLNNPQDTQVLAYDSSSTKWQNQESQGGSVSWDDIQDKPELNFEPTVANAKQSVIFQSSSSTDARPTSSSAVSVTWLTNYPEQPNNFQSGDLQFEIGEQI